MLTIPEEQLTALDASCVLSFENRLLKHLRSVLPDQMAFAGDEWAQRRQVRDAITTAWGHGFSSEVDIVRFVNLTVVLGRDFDLDPRWARVADGLRANGNPASRLDAAFLALAEVSR